MIFCTCYVIMWAKALSNVFFVFRFVATNYMPLGSRQIGLEESECLLRHRWVLLAELDAAGRFKT